MIVRKLAKIVLLTTVAASTGACGSPSLDDRLNDDTLMAKYVESLEARNFTQSQEEIEQHGRRVCRSLADGETLEEVQDQELRFFGSAGDIVVSMDEAVKQLCPEFDSSTS